MKNFLVLFSLLVAVSTSAQDTVSSKWSAELHCFYPSLPAESKEMDIHSMLNIFTSPDYLQKSTRKGLGVSIGIVRSWKKNWSVYADAGLWRKSRDWYYFTDDINTNSPENDLVSREVNRTYETKGFLLGAGLDFSKSFGKFIIGTGGGIVFTYSAPIQSSIDIKNATYSFTPGDHDSLHYSEQTLYPSGKGYGIDIHTQLGFAFSSHLTAYLKIRFLTVIENYSGDQITSSVSFEHYQTSSGPADETSYVTDYHRQINYSQFRFVVPTPFLSLRYHF